MSEPSDTRHVLPPSKEAMRAAKRINGYSCEAESYLSIVIDDAIRIDTAFAEHRERVRRLVEAAREARWILPLVEAAGKQQDAAKREQIIRRVQSAHEGIKDAMRAFPLLSEAEEEPRLVDVAALLAEIDALREENRKLQDGDLVTIATGTIDEATGNIVDDQGNVIGTTHRFPG